MEKMFCNQCEETVKARGCTQTGVCGKTSDTSNIQDLLIYSTKSLAYVLNALKAKGEKLDLSNYRIITNNLFLSITNANFDSKFILEEVKKTINLKDKLLKKLENKDFLPPYVLYSEESEEKLIEKSNNLHSSNEDKDIKSLKDLIFGLKGMAAYLHHAEVLKFEDREIYEFLAIALCEIMKTDLSKEYLTNLVLKTGTFGVRTMALLDEANISNYGDPEITRVNVGTRNNPAILISGHDLKDMELLLEQTENTGVDVYTHSEMLPANYYPKLKKYEHFVGNYGGSWHNQKDEFELFNGPILMTSNCIVPPKESYKDRIFTTGPAGFPGCKHIEAKDGKVKDFSEIIEMAKNTKPPTEIERGYITGGFAHTSVVALSDKIAEAVKNGDIKKFVVMAGCDGRKNSRNYYTEFAEKLPQDTIILTAGCAKYRYNKINLGSVAGIPRVLDAGQCNDSYSLAVIALKLQEVMGLDDINDLPIIYNIAWYEQKAVIVLLALLSIGIKNIHLGPSLPEFLSDGVLNVLVDNFGIKGIATVEEDLDYFFPDRDKTKFVFTGDTIIKEVLEKRPQKTNVLMEIGMHCLGCPSSQNETIEEAAAVHGVNTEELLQKLND